MRAFGPRGCATWAWSRSMSLSTGCSRRAWCSTTSTAAATTTAAGNTSGHRMWSKCTTPRAKSPTPTPPNDNGGREYFWPQDVEQVHDAAGKIIGARLIRAVGDWPAGSAIDYEGMGTMSKSRNNGVDPQELIGKYG